MYPLKNDPLPFDWDFSHAPNKGNVTEDLKQHVQNRLSWYSEERLSFIAAMYHFQGTCDPQNHQNCSDSNNDISTGGLVAPSPTNEQVYNKAADLSPFLRSLYEYHQDIKSLGVYFSNSGSGSFTFFPHYELDVAGSYISAGCEWMRQPNPIDPTPGPIGTEEEIARCHQKDTTVPTRDYNPLERGWCQGTCCVHVLLYWLVDCRLCCFCIGSCSGG